MIAVLGATGRIGRHVADALADRPVQARALVRRPTEVDLPLPTVGADLTDPGSVRAALEGATRMFLLAPSGPDQDLLEANAIAAAIDAGVEHVVKVSAGAASLGPNGVTATATAHWRAERLIEASGMGFTFLRPSMFAQGVLDLPRIGRGRATVLPVPFGRAPIAMVDLRDVAACAVAVLLDDTPATAAWQLTGPRGVTFDEVAAALGARYVPLAPTIAARALARRGAGAFEIDHAVRMAAYFASGADGAPTDHVLRLTGRAPRPIEALLTEATT